MYSLKLVFTSLHRHRKMKCIAIEFFYALPVFTLMIAQPAVNEYCTEIKKTPAWLISPAGV